MPYPSFYDPDSKALLAFSEVMPVRSPPTTFVLDEEGRIAAAIFGVAAVGRDPGDLVEDVAGESQWVTCSRRPRPPARWSWRSRSR